MGFSSSTIPDISFKEQTRMLCNCAKLRVRLAQESKGVKSKKQLLIDPTEGKDDYRQIVVDLAQGKDKTVRTLFIADEVEDHPTIKIDWNSWGQFNIPMPELKAKEILTGETINGQGTFLQEK